MNSDLFWTTVKYIAVLLVAIFWSLMAIAMVIEALA